MPATTEASRDLIVVLPGIMGSTLAKDGRLVWAPSAGAVVRAILTFGRSLKQLKLPKGVGDDHPGDGVEPVGLMPDLHLLPGVWTANIGYGALLNWLRSTFSLITARPENPERVTNLLPVPYDWRLSNRYNGRRLKRIVEVALERWRSQEGAFADAKLIFVCHSMGGLVARWYIEKEEGAAITRKLITLGTPYRGALKALDQLVNGVRKGIGPLELNLTEFARSLPSLHQLLPEYACIESPSGLLKTTEGSVPDLDTAMAADSMRFHEDLDSATDVGKPSYDIHPIAGTRQTTYTTARIAGGKLQPVETIDGNTEGGDATVPRLSAIPKGILPDSPIIRRIADQHGSLQSNQAVLDELEGVLAAQPVIHRGPAHPIELNVSTDPIILAAENLNIEAAVTGDERVALLAKVIDERDREIVRTQLERSKETYRVTLGPLPPGGYRVVVGGIGATASRVAPVTCAILVWDPMAA